MHSDIMDHLKDNYCAKIYTDQNVIKPMRGEKCRGNTTCLKEKYGQQKVILIHYIPG